MIPKYCAELERAGMPYEELYERVKAWKDAYGETFCNQDGVWLRCVKSCEDWKEYEENLLKKN